MTRPRILLAIIAAIVIAALVTLSLASNFLVDLLWFGSLGYRSVFLTMVGARWGVFAGVWLLTFAALLINGLAAVALSGDRERLHVVRRPNGPIDTPASLPDLLRVLGERVPWRLLVIVAAALLAAFVASGEADGWDVYLKALFPVPFGVTEPAFGLDVGFYVFTLPMLEAIRDLILLILFFSAVLTAAIYWIRGAVDFQQAPPRISRGVIGHLSVLMAVFFAQRAFGYWLDRYGLLLDSNGVVFGLRYIDALLWQPALWVLAALSISAAILCFANLRERGARLLVIAPSIVFIPAIALNLISPVIERLWVKPDELRVERPYLIRNISMTRSAFGLNAFDTKQFPGQGVLTPAALRSDAPTISNIRLWDPRPLIATYRQLQEIRLYYDFRDVDIDRYWIDGRYTQVMLSPRELNIDLLPENAQTWVNQHLKFTHGVGVAMSPVNLKDAEGLPVFYVKDIPPASSVGFKLTQPGIYFGEEPDNYCIVKGTSPEFDYPRGSDNVYSFYQADAGIPVSGLLRRLLFSFYYRDVNILFTDNIIDKSAILIRRNIRDRIGAIAPFLNQDRDPYVVMLDGRLVWIADCYTVSDRYPYSQRATSDQINYIRNSVKVVVDAYSGATDFYVADPDDPIIRCWQRIFPALFKPLKDMPVNLRAHIRYPEDLFLVQADVYRTYHMTDPQVFYNREDQWGFPRENYGGETVPMQPYYVIMRLPGEKAEEYILMLPMVPTGRDNMIAWLAARCDGDDYGHLFEYAFSKDALFYGPYQIQARINQNPDISRQLSLWNQMGSKVILGNLIVIPIQNSLLYVEPLFIRAENGQLPELQRVVAAYSDRVVMSDDLDGALAALFTGAPAVIPAVASAPSAAGSSPLPVLASDPLHQASDHYNRAMGALRSGDWTSFGAEMQKLGAALAQPSDSTHH